MLQRLQPLRNFLCVCMFFPFCFLLFLFLFFVCLFFLPPRESECHLFVVLARWWAPYSERASLPERERERERERQTGRERERQRERERDRDRERTTDATAS